MKRSMSWLLRWQVILLAMAVLTSIVVIIFREKIMHTYKRYHAMRMLDPRTFSEEEKINGAHVIVKSCMNIKRAEWQDDPHDRQYHDNTERQIHA